MREQKTVEIQGEEYLLNQFGALEGLTYQKALASVIMPAIAEITSRDNMSEGEALSIGMNKLAENIDKIDENMIQAMVVRGATKGNMSINFDNEFAGNYMKLFNLLKEIVVFNFDSVFTMLGSEEE
jgi:hypothetical protein